MTKITENAANSIDDRNLILVRKIMTVCQDKRAEDVFCLDMRKACNFADFFVIATTNNPAQMKGIAKEVARQMKAAHSRQISRDHTRTSSWLLMDYGDILLHLFDEDARDYYCLEGLWADARRIKMG